MISTNLAFDQANELAEAERLQGVARVQRQAHGPGRRFCLDCGDHIPSARRIAHPSAKRCVTCQADFEREGD